MRTGRRGNVLEIRLILSYRRQRLRSGGLRLGRGTVGFLISLLCLVRLRWRVLAAELRAVIFVLLSLFESLDRLRRVRALLSGSFFFKSHVDGVQISVLILRGFYQQMISGLQNGLL